MELEKAANLARGYLAHYGLSYCNVLFYEPPSPQGVAGSNTLGLSATFVEMNNEETVSDTILHECAHLLEPDDREHGLDWQTRTRHIDGLHEKTFSPEFEEFLRAYRSEKTLFAKGEKFMDAVAQAIFARGDEGVKGAVDFYTFTSPRRREEML